MGCSPWVSLPPERAQPSELVVVNPSPTDPSFVVYRAWFPAGVAVEPTTSQGLAQTTTQALVETLEIELKNPDDGTLSIHTQVDLDWVVLGLQCAVEQEPRCTRAWVDLVNLATLPRDSVERALSVNPQISALEPSAQDWLEALLFDGHTYGRAPSYSCVHCSHDDVAQYYASTFRSEWARWGVWGAFPRESLDRIDRALSEQESTISPPMNRFSPATWKQTRVAILPTEAPERSLIVGNTKPVSWQELPTRAARDSLPRRWEVVHQAPSIPPQTNVIEVIQIGLAAWKAATPPTPVEPSQTHDPLTTALVKSLPSHFPQSILGPRSTAPSAWTFVLSSPTPEQDLAELEAAIEQGIISPVEAWVLEVPRQAPEPTWSPSTTKPGASM